MNYYELKIHLSPNSEIHRDILASELAEIGFESFSESENGLDAFVPETLFSEDKIIQLLKNPPLIDAQLQYSIEYIESHDWNEEWEKNFFQPIIIDNQTVIHSSFHQNIPALKYDIVIDPKMAFGTGHHATTSLMVSYLLENELNGKSFLDMGCGTAVLAILASMKGAEPVSAIDNDEWAYENSLENIRLNHTSNIKVSLGDAGLLGNEMYDFIFANINRNILLADIQTYVKCMHRDSSLFMSGFYTEDQEAIRKECEKHGLKFVSYKEKENWTAMHFLHL
ncbi:ribosomal protein L11 methyltransferase [Bacteroidia bacterium]|nr:ribosomal protein L11 methyltransferase [Bacteroidia bacterium]